MGWSTHQSSQAQLNTIQLRQSTLEMLRCRSGEWKRALAEKLWKPPFNPTRAPLMKATGLTKYVDKPALIYNEYWLQWGAARRGIIPIQLVPPTTKENTHLGEHLICILLVFKNRDKKNEGALKKDQKTPKIFRLRRADLRCRTTRGEFLQEIQLIGW